MSAKNARAGRLPNQDFNNASRATLKLARSTKEMEGGFRFSFDANSNSLKLLCELIDAERQCCPFLTFVLRVPAHKNALILEIKGHEGAKRRIRAELLID